MASSRLRFAATAGALPRIWRSAPTPGSAAICVIARSLRGVPTRRIHAAAQTPVPQTPGPLDGIRVLDLTRVLAGPFCTMMLGDLGADVIKVESPGGGDETRRWGPPYAKPVAASSKASPGESAYFLGINRNKRSIVIDFKSAEGIKMVQNLATTADVVVENYVPGKLDAMGLGYDQLRRLNPRLVYASITGYGPTGPYAHHAGYDVIIEAEAGLMHITGEPDGRPVKVGVAITDITTGLHAHGAIMAALFARERTGVGQKIDVSLLECQVAALANVAHAYLIGGVEARRWGTQHSSIVPYQAFLTSDGDVVVGAGNDRQFAKFCNALGCPDIIHDDRFVTNAKRVEHRVELIDIISRITRTKTTQEWLDILEPQRIPYGPVNTIAQTFAHPQVKHRDMVIDVDHPTAGRIQLTGIPVKYSDTLPSVRRPPPLLGQHTREILTNELGVSQSKVDSLVAAGVVEEY